MDSLSSMDLSLQGVYSSSLAEYVLAACSYFNKDISRLQRNREARKWDRFTMGELRGKTMGIVGYGEIGSKVARLAKAYGMEVVAVRRHRERSLGDPLVDNLLGMDSLPELMKCSDFIVVSAALTPATTNLIDADMLSRMKAGAVIVNIGRGPIINEAALVNALSEGAVYGAALDVFTVEPLPADSKLWSLPNVLISPHNADKTETARKESVQWFLTLCPAFLNGKLTSSVDPVEGY
jgi:phosphoglycerate dehydrogenase-like enzyme